MNRKLLLIPVVVAFVMIAGFRAARNDAPQAVEQRPDVNDLYTIRARNAKDLRNFFRYSTDRLPFISAHRGGPREGYPENCIATFEHTLSRGHAILEIDPRYTKDGHIVLMHDATLDRTTNGSGKVSDHTLQEIRQLRLKDTEGNLTEHRIPTFDEALQWAKGKTILVIDEKDVPIEVRVQKIVENKAEASAIVIAYSMADIKKCHALNKDVMMEVMMGKMSNVTDFDESGVPWENVVGFVSHNIPEGDEIFNEVHRRGTMCILGSSRNYDRQYTAGEINLQELTAGYQRLIDLGADIIEADLAIEAVTAVKPMQTGESSKKKYFRNLR